MEPIPDLPHFLHSTSIPQSPLLPCQDNIQGLSIGFHHTYMVRPLPTGAFSALQLVDISRSKIVETIADARDGFATQAGMEKMEVALRDDMERMETSLRGDMRNEIEQSELRIRADIQTEFKRLYWYIPAVMGAVIGILKLT